MVSVEENGVIGWKVAKNGLSLVGTNPTMLPRRICTRVYVTNGPKTILPETRAQHGNALCFFSAHTRLLYSVLLNDKGLLWRLRVAIDSFAFCQVTRRGLVAHWHSHDSAHNGALFLLELTQAPLPPRNLEPSCDLWDKILPKRNSWT